MVFTIFIENLELKLIKFDMIHCYLEILKIEGEKLLEKIFSKLLSCQYLTCFESNTGFEIKI